ncbi:hypothetical protein HDU67_003186, partial [Dinochytrium kinnereticum]
MDPLPYDGAQAKPKAKVGRKRKIRSNDPAELLAELDQKRQRNTEAARRSRLRKMAEMEVMQNSLSELASFKASSEDKFNAMQAEMEEMKRKLAVANAKLAAAGLPAVVGFILDLLVSPSVGGPVKPLLSDAALNEGSTSPQILVGIGIGDVTGPIGGVNMMGYAMPQQKTQGLHQRLKARAFIFSDGSQKVAIVNVDACMMGDAIKRRVLERVGEMIEMTDETLSISATHTHSGPGGYLEHVLYQITSMGLVDDSLDAIVDGIVDALTAANANLRPSRLFLSAGEIKGAAINRSPTAYENNPADERAMYDSNVDETMTQLNVFDETGPRGVLNWFPVHLTSLNSSNRLVSPDNKGYAALKMEKGRGGGFVAGFAQ